MNFIKKTALLLTLLAVASAAYGQDPIPDQNAKGKWGYVDANGKKVIDYKYDEALAFVDGRAKVKKGDKYGYIGTNGKEVIKIQYTEMGTWDRGRCKVAVGGKDNDGVLTGAKYGYIGYSGDALLKPEYDKIGPWENDMAYVMKGGKYGYIDQMLKLFVPCKYTALGTFNHQGFCWVAEGGAIKGGKVSGAKYGVINRLGEIVVKPQYRMLGTFNAPMPEANPIYSRILNSAEGREAYKKKLKEANKGAASQSFFGALTGSLSTEDLMEEAGRRARNAAENFVAQMTGDLSEEERAMMAECPSWDMIGYSYIDGTPFTALDMSMAPYFAVSNMMLSVTPGQPFILTARSNDKVGIIRDNGDVVVKPGAYNLAFLPTEGLIPVMKASGKGLQTNYVKPDGKLLLKKWVNSTGISPFKDGVAVVAAESGQYLIDRQGNTISSNYEIIFPQSSARHLVKGLSGFGIIRSDGAEVIAPTWSLILPENGNLFCARKSTSGKFGYLDGDGNFVIEPQYQHARSFSGATACVSTDTGWGVIDGKNTAVVPFEYEDVLPVSEFTPEFCWVKKEGLWTAMNVNSKTPAFQTTFHGVQNYDKDGIAVVSSAQNLYGCVDRSGNLIIPMRMSTPSLISMLLEKMQQDGQQTVSDIEAYRFNLNNNPARNGFRLSHVIDNSMWEY